MNKLIQTILTFLFLSLIPSLIFAAASDEVKTSSEDFETTTFEDEIYDPLEGVNRAIFGFNNVADKIVLEPIAKGYKKLPSPIQSGVGNFINNLKLPLAALNQLLQGQTKNAAESTGRFLVNSTIGVFGLIDVAEILALIKKKRILDRHLQHGGLVMDFILFYLYSDLLI
jgi:phospholipid-binding lipoprotein MlaA